MSPIEKAKNFAVGVDIGGTKTLLALVSDDGKIVKQLEFKTLPEQGEERILQQIEANVEQLIAYIPQDGKLKGIGIVSAGVIDSEQLSIVYASNLGWHDVKVGAILKEKFNVDVVLGNDANLSGVAEYVWGAKQQVKDLIYITVSTGIGAGIISGGQLIKGVSDSAGEFGHISVDLKGEQCKCGNYGCLENYCSGTALASIANERLAPLAGQSWTSRDVLEQAVDGNSEALEIVKEAAFYLGNGVVSLIHLFNPSQIVFGGGVMSSEGILFTELKKVVEERALPEMLKKVTMRQTELGKEIAVLGAAGVFFMNHHD